MSDSTQWYYAHNNQQQGPVDTATLHNLVASGQVSPSDLAWRDGMANWQAISGISELQPAAAAPMSSPPPSPPPAASPGFPAQPQYPGAPQPQYPGGPQYMNPAAVGDTSGKATTAMVLGIISLVTWLCPLIGLAVGIPAWIMGAKYKDGPNGGHAKAGMIMGIIGTILSGLNAIVGVIIQVSRLV